MRTNRVEALKNWLGVERNFYSVFGVLAGFIAFWKGFRLPYAWAATQAQLDYRFGIVRLGLFGAVCSWLHLRIIDYRVFSLVAFAILFFFLFLLFRTAIKSGLASPLHGLLLVLVASSFCVSFLVNVVGYLDVTLVVLLLLALRTRGYIPQLIAVAGAAVLGCLTHELYLVAFLPISLMNLVRRAEDEGFSLRNALPLLVVSIGPTVLVLLLCGHLALTQQQMQALLQDWHAHANFPVRDDFFLVLKKPLAQCFKDSYQYFRSGEWWIEEVIVGAVFFPATLFFLFIAYRFLGEGRKWTRIYVTLAVLSPMALNLIAVDFDRWMNFAALNALIAAIVAARGLERGDSDPLPQKPFGVLARNTAMLLIALNLASNAGMFVPGTDFSFLPHWRRFRENRLRHRPMFSYRDPGDYTF